MKGIGEPCRKNVRNVQWLHNFGHKAWRPEDSKGIKKAWKENIYINYAIRRNGKMAVDNIYTIQCACV